MSADGRSVVITGGNSGIGLAAAKLLRRHGADVVLACRDVARSQQQAPGFVVRELDLADLESVRRFAEETGRLDALVCNAGVMGGLFSTTPQGIERMMGTNHFGHAALVARLFPRLGRVVMISSIAARGGGLTPQTTVEDLTSPLYDAERVYGSSKQANLLFAQELHRRVGDRMPTTAAHPGVSWTNLFLRKLRDEGRGYLVPVAHVLGPLLFQSARAGAKPTVAALSAPSGTFLGPRAFNQWRGRPHVLDVYPSASDPATAARLWQLTEEVLGLDLPA